MSAAPNLPEWLKRKNQRKMMPNEWREFGKAMVKIYGHRPRVNDVNDRRAFALWYGGFTQGLLKK